MQICIVTQQLKANYGGILQNYALQAILKMMGHNVMTIDYIYKPTLFRFFLSICKSRLRKHDYPDLNYIRPSAIQNFIDTYINVTNTVHKYKLDIIYQYKIDAIIVGSDQVWRPQYNRGVLEDMFLKFTKDIDIKRIAYAASFGVDTMKEYKVWQIKEAKKLIKKFDLVTVREDSGVKLCKDYLNINAIHVLDPTMLLNKEDYLKICDPVPVDKTNFIAAYILDKTTHISNITTVAEKNNLSLKLFSADKHLTLTIEEWLSIFRDAKFIITDSFHGTVFSLIFNKPFLTITNKVRGNARIDSLLRTFGLLKRQIYSCSDIELDYNINWKEINYIKEEYAKISKNLLRINLGNQY